MSPVSVARVLHGRADMRACGYAGVRICGRADVRAETKSRVAGQSAAWLPGHMLVGRDCAVWRVLSCACFRAEEARAQGFRAALAELFSSLHMVVVSEGTGLDRSTYELKAAALAADRRIEAVYSIGGGKRAILRAFDECGRECRAFVAHDLDAKNR